MKQRLIDVNALHYRMGVVKNPQARAGSDRKEETA